MQVRGWGPAYFVLYGVLEGTADMDLILEMRTQIHQAVFAD